MTNWWVVLVLSIWVITTNDLLLTCFLSSIILILILRDGEKGG